MNCLWTPSEFNSEATPRVSPSARNTSQGLAVQHVRVDGAALHQRQRGNVRGGPSPLPGAGSLFYGPHDRL